MLEPEEGVRPGSRLGKGRLPGPRGRACVSGAHGRRAGAQGQERAGRGEAWPAALSAVSAGARAGGTHLPGPVVKFSGVLEPSG